MKVTTSWLNSLMDRACDSSEMVTIFNSLGLEVDACYKAPVPFSGVVVGRVEKLEPHPKRSDLTVCTVLISNSSDETVQVVCGDLTLKVRERVVLAQSGAKLPDGRSITKTNIHGVESAGMLCSGKELAISPDEDTVWRMSPNGGTIGECPSESMFWDDDVLDLDLTPNRGDCFSILGLARELRLITGVNFKSPLEGDMLQLSQTSDETVTVKVHAPEACPIYHGIVVKNVPHDVANLYRLRKDLTCCGLRPVNYVVDCLNYELMETGQPTHAFDLEKVKDGIVVRYARAGEKILLLDGTDVTLDASTLVIASGDKPVAIAGVMGSLDSAVSDNTKDIFLEVAYFTPDAVRGTARKYGLQSEASLRFERGVDFAIQAQALQRACQRLESEVPSNLKNNETSMAFGPLVSTVSTEHIPARTEIFLPAEMPENRIGYKIEHAKVNETFKRLEFNVREEEDGWWLTPPPHRYDVQIPEDFVEEICRVFGYDNIPSTPLRAPITLRASKRKRGDARELRTNLCVLGYSEAITYSFISKSENALFNNSNNIPELVNPISIERAVMRCSIVPGLLTVAAYNIARQESAIRLFEYGQCFEYDEARVLQQKDHVAGVLLGTRNPESWANERQVVDFFDVKSDLESLLSFAEVDFDPVDCNWLDRGHSATVRINGNPVGVVGKVRREIAHRFQLEQDAFAFELDATSLCTESHACLTEVSPFPTVRRDLALILDRSVTIRQIKTVVQDTLKDLLWDFVVFDVFGGEQFEEHQHSIGIGITLRHLSRTLLDEEVNALMDNVVHELSTQFHAKLRT